MSRSIPILLGIALPLLSLTAVAQSTFRVLRVSIPFEFHIGQRAMPAGDYELRYRGNGVIEVARQEDNRNRVAFLTMPLEPTVRDSNQKPHLVFQRLGSIKFLNQVWGGGVSTGYRVPANRKSRESLYTASRQEPDNVVLFAQR